MPYSGPNDPDLPKNVKRLSKAKREKWVATWNAAYERCKKNGGDHGTCETRAFRIANGTISNESIQTCTLAYLQHYPNARWEDAVLWCAESYERHQQAMIALQDEASGGSVLLENRHTGVLVEEATAEERKRFAFVFSANVIPAPTDEHGVWSKNNRLYPPRAVKESFERSVQFLQEGGVATVFANHSSADGFAGKLPVGAVTKYYREGDAFRFRAGIVDTTEGQDVIRLVNAGVLQTISLRSHDWKSRREEIEGHGECEVIEYAVVHGVDFAIYPGLPGTNVKKEEHEMDLKQLTLAELQDARPDLVAEILEQQPGDPEVVYQTSPEETLRLAIAEASNTGLGSLVAKYLTEHCESPEDIDKHIEAARAHALSEMYKGRRGSDPTNLRGQGGRSEHTEEEDEEEELTETQQDMVRIVKAAS